MSCVATGHLWSLTIWWKKRTKNSQRTDALYKYVSLNFLNGYFARTHWNCICELPKRCSWWQLYVLACPSGQTGDWSVFTEVRQEAVQQALAAMQNKPKPSLPMPSKRTSAMTTSPSRERHPSGGRPPSTAGLSLGKCMKSCCLVVQCVDGTV